MKTRKQFQEETIAARRARIIVCLRDGGWWSAEGLRLRFRREGYGRTTILADLRAMADAGIVGRDSRGWRWSLIQEPGDTNLGRLRERKQEAEG